jgi:hypothetical protein
MAKGTATMGSVLPREKSPVESVPCKGFTRSTSAALAFAGRGFAGALPLFPDGACAVWSAPARGSRVEAIATAPPNFKNARLLAPIPSAM